MSLLGALVVAGSVGLMMLAVAAVEMIVRSKPEELEQMDVCLRYGRSERAGTNCVIKTRQVPRRDLL